MRDALRARRQQDEPHVVEHHEAKHTYATCICVSTIDSNLTSFKRLIIL